MDALLYLPTCILEGIQQKRASELYSLFYAE